MLQKTNFHTHTRYCDGRNTVEEMIQAAISKKFAALGFSGHSYTSYDTRYCMAENDVKQYQNEIRTLQKKYAEQISIFCGIEQDFYAESGTDGFDYVIGSVHAIFQNGTYHTIDVSKEETACIIKDVFGGDFIKCAECYFKTVAQVVQKTNADIIGHFDLITKFYEKNPLLEQKRYRLAAQTAMEHLLQFEKPFEINTGAMYRGLRTEPYPAVWLLKELHKKGGRVILSSDSHDTNSLGYGFEMVLSMIQEIGFREICVWTKNGLQEVDVANKKVFL